MERELYLIPGTFERVSCAFTDYTIDTAAALSKGDTTHLVGMVSPSDGFVSIERRQVMFAPHLCVQSLCAPARAHSLDLSPFVSA